MEASEQVMHGAIGAPDLAELVGRPGPFLSVLLTTQQQVENAAQRSASRWRSLRSDLDDQGVPNNVLDEIEPLVPDAHLEGECLAVIADAEGILHIEHGPALEPNDRGSWGPLPRLLPILRWRQSQPPYAVVLTDRTGADIFGFHPGSPEFHVEVEGEHDVIRKVQAGGWSQRRYQERAEDSWQGNAERVAERVTRLVDRIAPAFVVVAGDVRAVQLLRTSLPRPVDELVHVVDGERPWEGKGDPLPDETGSLVEEHVREATDGLLARFSEERGQHDKAVEGPDATAHALARSQVAVLLVADVPSEDRTLSFGPEPALLAPTDPQLKELGVDSPQRGPARDVLVRAALGTGARIRVLDEGDALKDGAGAMLRWH